VKDQTNPFQRRGRPRELSAGLVNQLTDLVKALAGHEMKLPPAAIPKFNALYQELSRIDERRGNR